MGMGFQVGLKEVTGAGVTLVPPSREGWAPRAVLGPAGFAPAPRSSRAAPSHWKNPENWEMSLVSHREHPLRVLVWKAGREGALLFLSLQ